MGDNTKIEWADATVNAVNGCSVLSPGCTNCYAMKLAGTRMKSHPTRAGLTIDTKAGPVWTGKVRMHEPALLQPLSWKRPRRIFWNAHGDLFHEAVPDEWIDRVFAVCALTPQHTHMILTKRSARMREYFSALKSRTDPFAEAADEIADVLCMKDHPAVPEPQDFPLPNVMLGVSVEDQTRAVERIPDLLATPAAVRFISAEPLLGPVNLRRVRIAPDHHTIIDALDGYAMTDTPGRERERTMLDWVIAGGESGPKARPMHPDWVRSLRDQCQDADVPFFFKQWGEFAPGEIAGDFLNPEKTAKGMVYFDGRWDDEWSYPDGHVDDEPDVYRIGKSRAGRLLDGREWSEFPTLKLAREQGAI